MKTELDEWSLGEKLCLAASVVNKGENWAQVSKNMETWSNTSKTTDWYSQKNCALQYSELLEKYAGSKKKRVDAAGELILRKLTIDRINELTLAIQEEREQYLKLKQEVKLIESKQLDHRLEEIWDRMQGEAVVGQEDEEMDQQDNSNTVEREGDTIVHNEEAEQILVKEEPPTPLSHLECVSSAVHTTSGEKDHIVTDISVGFPKEDTIIGDVQTDKDVDMTLQKTEDSVTDDARSAKEDTFATKIPVLIDCIEDQRAESKVMDLGTTDLVDELVTVTEEKANDKVFAVTTETEVVCSANEDKDEEQGKSLGDENQVQKKEIIACSDKTDDKSDFELSNSGDESSILDTPGLPPRVIIKSEPEDSSSRSAPRVDTSDSITEESDTSESVSRKDADNSSKASRIDLEKSPEAVEVNLELDDKRLAGKDISDDSSVMQSTEKGDVSMKRTETFTDVSQQSISANISLSEGDSMKQVDVYEFVADDEDATTDSSSKPQNVQEESISPVEIKIEPSPKPISYVDEAKDKETVILGDVKPSIIERKATSEERIVQVDKVAIGVRPTEGDKPLDRHSIKATDLSEEKRKVPEVEPIVKSNKARQTPEKVSEPPGDFRDVGGEPSMFTLRVDSLGSSQSSSPEVKRYESKSPWSFASEPSKKLPSLTSPSREMIKVDSFDRASRDDSRFRRFDPTRREEKITDEPSVSIVEKQIYVDESSLSRLERKLSHRSRILSESDMSDFALSSKSDRLSTLSTSHEFEEDRLSDRRSAKKRHSSPTETPLSSMPSSPASSITIRDGEMDDKAYKTWKKAIMLVWREIAQHKYASIFLQPITDKDAPGYHNVVNRPVDLQKIKRNIECGTLRTTAEFQREILLMFLNAIMYNSSDHDVHVMAKEMQQEAINIVQEFLNTQMLMKTTEVVKTSRRETRESSSKKVDSEEELPNKRKRSSSIAEEKLPKRKRLEKL